MDEWPSNSKQGEGSGVGQRERCVQSLILFVLSTGNRGAPQTRGHKQAAKEERGGGEIPARCLQSVRCGAESSESEWLRAQTFVIIDHNQLRSSLLSRSGSSFASWLPFLGRPNWAGGRVSGSQCAPRENEQKLAASSSSRTAMRMDSHGLPSPPPLDSSKHSLDS